MARGKNDVVINFFGRDFMSRATRENAREMKKFTKSVAESEREARKAGHTYERTAKKVKGVYTAAGGGGKSLGRIGLAGGFSMGGVAVSGTLAAGALFAGKALSQAEQVEMGWAKVMSLIRDRSDQELYSDRIKEIIRDQTRLGRSVDEVSDALFAQVSQRGASEESFRALDAGMKLAIAGFADTKTSVEVVNKLLENFPELAGDAMRAASMIYTAQVFGATNVQEMGAYIPDLAAVAASQGMAADETLAFVTTLTLKLGGTAKAATAAKSLVMALAQATPEAQKALRAMRAPRNIVEFKQLGLEESLRRLNAAIKENPTLLRKAVPALEAIQAATAMTTESIDKMRVVQGAMTEDFREGTGMMDSYNRVMSTAAVQRQQAAQATNEVLNRYGQQMQPGEKVALQGYTSFAREVADNGFWTALSDAHQRLEYRTARALGTYSDPSTYGPRVMIEIMAEEGLKAKAVVEGAEGLDVGVQVRGK